MLPFHPYADLFPLIEGEAFAELVADIKANDVREKIVVWDGAILDGRNRYRAALEAELIDTDENAERGRYFTRFIAEIDGDPLKFVISKNLKRRHLNDDQRRMVAAKLANMGRGRPAENPAECGIKVSDAARLVNVDEAGTERARTVLAHAAPEIKAAVDRGKLSVAAAAQAARLDAPTQRRIATEAEGGRLNAAKSVVKQETRAARESALGQQQAALPAKKYGVIVADPEWRFEPWSCESGMDRAADNHYPTSCLDVIKSRDVASIAAKDCVLFLWATAPMLPHALAVMDAWGFDYRSNYVWSKDRIGTGYWNRNAHEHLLIGVKGNIPAPAPGTQRPSVIEGRVTKHSAKPDVFLEMIEAYFPTLPKIELNRRGPARPGWHAWGNESESVASPTPEPACVPFPQVPARAGSPLDDDELPHFSKGAWSSPLA